MVLPQVRGGGALGACDPRVRFLCLLVYFLAAFHARGLPALCVCVGVAVACAFAARLGVRGFFGVLRPLAPVLVVTVVMQVLYLHSGAVLVELGPVQVTSGALAAAARMLACLLAVMVASVSFMRVTPVEDLLFTLRWLLLPLQRAGVRTEGVVFALNVAFRFVPVLLGEFKQLKRAQEARLAAFDGGVRQRLAAYTRLFAPLVRSSFRRADALAEASVTRAFGCGVRPTTAREHGLGASDAVIAAVTLAVAAIAFG